MAGIPRDTPRRQAPDRVGRSGPRPLRVAVGIVRPNLPPLQGFGLRDGAGRRGVTRRRPADAAPEHHRALWPRTGARGAGSAAFAVSDSTSRRRSLPGVGVGGTPGEEGREPGDSGSGCSAAAFRRQRHGQQITDILSRIILGARGPAWENVEMKETRHILMLSGGKDSTALAIYMRDRVPDMEYVFCDTDKELPETYEYLDKIEFFLGKKIVRLRDDRGFDHWLQVYGGYLPSSQMRWCTRMLKIKPFEKYVDGDEVMMYVGIRADEDRTAYVS